jgi:hypothetical protein
MYEHASRPRRAIIHVRGAAVQQRQQEDQMRQSQQGTLWGVLALVGQPVAGQPEAATPCALGLAEAAWQ